MRDDEGTAWTLWQYTDVGQVPGIDGPVDKNVLHPEVSVVSLQIIR
jgi:GH25 family lysozyme M1 (1,4-beta-N-acetylmuramidase)